MGGRFPLYVYTLCSLSALNPAASIRMRSNRDRLDLFIGPTRATTGGTVYLFFSQHTSDWRGSSTIATEELLPNHLMSSTISGCLRFTLCWAGKHITSKYKDDMKTNERHNNTHNPRSKPNPRKSTRKKKRLQEINTSVLYQNQRTP